MKHSDYYRVRSIVPCVHIADVDSNASSIIRNAEVAFQDKVKLAVFPELSLTGYTCSDLFHQSLLLDKTINALRAIKMASDKWPGMVIAVGAPIVYENSLYNCGVIIGNGTIYGIVPKTFLPNYNEFYEKRWFSPGTDIPAGAHISIDENDIPIGCDLLFKHNSSTISVDICEDLWATIPPSSKAVLNGSNIVVNLSASNEVVGKHEYLLDLIKQHSAGCLCGYIYSSAGCGESSTDLVYSGNAIICENGRILSASPRFTATEMTETADIDLILLKHERLSNSTFADCSRLYRKEYRTICCSYQNNVEATGNELLRRVNRLPFVPNSEVEIDKRCEEIIAIQTEGLMQRLRATGCRNAVIGISGGLDSTLALLITAKAFERLGLDKSGIVGITMPGFGTTDRTYDNALALIKLLGATLKEISIVKSVKQHFNDICHPEDVHDVTYENSQARERTQILMDYANKCNGMVIGTGDLSELALGWCTYNGDQMSMYGVNASIPKTLVRHLVKYVAITSENEKLRSVLNDIIDTPISPELIPADDKGKIVQKTEDLVGPYELHDFFIYNMLRNGFSPSKIYDLAILCFSEDYSASTIKHWLTVFFRRFFNQQFKRSCMPDGPKVGSVCLSPRGDWRMPSDATVKGWLDECEKL